MIMYYDSESSIESFIEKYLSYFILWISHSFKGNCV